MGSRLMKERNNFPHKNIRRFFIIQGIFGLLSVYGLLALPASESDRAIWMGLSLFRLLTIIVSFTLTILLLLMIFFSYTATSKLDSTWNKISRYFVNHQLLLSAIIALSFIFSVSFISLEFLLNSSVFPRAIFYKYLYDRIWPISLWASVFCGHLFLFIRKQLWITYPIQGKPYKAISKKRAANIIFILISWSGMIILWLRYADLGKDFINHYFTNTTLVISSLTFMLLPIYLSHDTKN